MCTCYSRSYEGTLAVWVSVHGGAASSLGESNGSAVWEVLTCGRGASCSRGPRRSKKMGPCQGRAEVVGIAQ